MLRHHSTLSLNIFLETLSNHAEKNDTKPKLHLGMDIQIPIMNEINGSFSIPSYIQSSYLTFGKVLYTETDCAELTVKPDQ